MIKTFKRILMNTHINNILKNILKAPKRCARNIIELGLNSTKKQELKVQKESLYHTLYLLIKQCKIEEIKKWFFKTFF